MPSDPGPTRRPRWAAWLGACLVATLPVGWLVNHTIPRPGGLGVREGRLAACPNSPNCVNSQAADNDSHRIAPLPLRGSVEASKNRLKDILESTSGARRTEENDTYLAYEFRSRIWRFVDDVEFVFDIAAGVIHVRSASRVGYSDLGANRRRIERIRRHWNAD